MFAEELRVRRAGSLRIAGMPAVTCGFLTRHIGRLVARRPEIAVTLHGLPSHLIADGVASGGYDFGIAEASVERQGLNVETLPAKALAAVPEGDPLALRDTLGPKDFEGRTLGGAQGTPTTRLLPVFIQKNALAADKIKVTNMAPNLQEPMLIKGDIDAALVFNITSYFNLVLNRQDPDKDFKWFSFGDFGLDLYSNGICVSQKLIASNPKAVAGLVRAVNKAMIAVAKDQNAGMASVVAFDNLVDVPVEKRRLQYSFDKLIISPEMKEIGVGDIKDDRMTRAIGMVVEGYDLKRVPTAKEVFSREFLPPRKDRELVYVAN